MYIMASNDDRWDQMADNMFRWKKKCIKTIEWNAENPPLKWIVVRRSFEYRSFCAIQATRDSCPISAKDSIAFQRVELKHQENCHETKMASHQGIESVEARKKSHIIALINTSAYMKSTGGKNVIRLSYKIQYLYRRRLSDFIFYVIALKSNVVESK